MSVLASERRQRRRDWAMAGGRHDIQMAILRVLLPALVGIIALFLAVAPLTVGADISFVLSKKGVDVAPERMRVSHAVYRGRDGKNQPFILTAASAVQQTSRDPILRLQTLHARIGLTDGPADVTAPRGRYDMNSDRIAVDGPVHYLGSGGYRVDTRDVLIDLRTRMLKSRGAVDGTMPLGTFAADQMRANLETKVIDLVGRARLHIVQRQARAAR
ncbi:LPS export ABC transporter periplasmic protein LptC [Sphingomonas sp. AP4-R1]|uniref:LPS export ABC transporter periplasmic protein LptC n=1 Tax=Sphingomonas sp. AP4-R1 TaxID=2735134 RepID=UPI0014932B03|nr:LPS export ABC transporter periplasmic protein LptC [Sphingomonas sp. AP4-R1]QJU59630.1 LPS export ABC transporter periplasmic protein LptC [Sphingomonas sp. AP4-R1]